jgi:putative endonuclease
VYVIKNPKNQLYKGCTGNLDQRFFQHNHEQTRWTKLRGPWVLVYREYFRDKKEALKREKFLKSGQGREFLKKTIGL